MGHEIIGREAIGAEGFKLGKIDDIIFDEKSWSIVAFKIKLEKDVAERHNVRQRFRKSYVMVNVGHVQAIGDRVLLNSSNEEIMKLITFPGPSRQDPSTAQEFPNLVAGEQTRR